jgi:hypothetical protein
VSPVRYELGFYIPEDCILQSHRRGNLKSYVASFELGSTVNKDYGFGNYCGRSKGTVPAFPSRF